MKYVVIFFLLEKDDNSYPQYCRRERHVRRAESAASSAPAANGSEEHKFR